MCLDRFQHIVFYLFNLPPPLFSPKRDSAVHIFHPPKIFSYLGFVSFKVRFLPPNVTSLIQPMDQGAIECTKRGYRRQLLRHLLFVHSEEDFMEEFKALNVLHACQWLGSSWAAISPTTLRNVWNKLLGQAGRQRQAQDSEDIELELLQRIEGKRC